MQTVKIAFSQDQGTWLGYLQDYPDYRTQGETLDDLKAHLRDLHQDLASGEVSGVRRADTVVVPTSAVRVTSL